MKDLKKAVSGEKAEMMRVVGEIQRLTDRERQTTDPSTQQLVKKLRRTASDAQIRYNQVQCFAVILLKLPTLHQRWCRDSDSDSVIRHTTHDVVAVTTSQLRLRKIMKRI